MLHPTLLLLFSIVQGTMMNEKSKAEGPYVHGVEFTEEINITHAACFNEQGYEMAFIRVYNGEPDEIGLKNMQTAYSKLSVQLVVVPELDGVKSPYTQVDEIIRSAHQHGWKFYDIWLQITSPLTWNKSIAKNIEFIQDFVREASKRGINVQYYTNWYDYKTITGNSSSLKESNLWYWNVLGEGEGAETPSNFDDFRPFGPFRKARAKQYSQGKKVCGIQVNQIAYLRSDDNISNRATYIGKKTT